MGAAQRERGQLLADLLEERGEIRVVLEVGGVLLANHAKIREDPALTQYVVRHVQESGHEPAAARGTPIAEEPADFAGRQPGRLHLFGHPVQQGHDVSGDQWGTGNI